MAAKKKAPTPHSTSSPWLKKIGQSSLTTSEKAMAKRLWKKMEKAATRRGSGGIKGQTAKPTDWGA